MRAHTAVRADHQNLGHAGSEHRAGPDYAPDDPAAVVKGRRPASPRLRQLAVDTADPAAAAPSTGSSPRPSDG
jgi:hypothetical protein